MAKTGNINTNTTQDFLDVHDITNNFVILKNGSVSIVLTVSSMNFGLLAEAEQDAVIYSYAALLNSLNYPIQIVIQSKTKDATTYLNTLKAQEEKASINRREMIARYRQFVSELIKERNVLDKNFYVVVSATAVELGLMSVQSVIPGNTKLDINSVEKSLILEKASTVLEPKRDHLLAQFNRIGLYARQLDTQEIIQIFYNSYNPESYEGQAITDSNSYTTALVQAQIIGGNMNILSNQNTNQVGVLQDAQQPAMAQQPTIQQPITQQPAVAQQPVAQQSTNTQQLVLAQQPVVDDVQTQTNQPSYQTPSPDVDLSGIQEPVASLNIPQNAGAQAQVVPIGIPNPIQNNQPAVASQIPSNNDLTTTPPPTNGDITKPTLTTIDEPSTINPQSSTPINDSSNVAPLNINQDPTTNVTPQDNSTADQPNSNTNVINTNPAVGELLVDSAQEAINQTLQEIGTLPDEQTSDQTTTGQNTVQPNNNTTTNDALPPLPEI